MPALAPHTGKIFDAVCKMESIKPYVLVGGTALSLQIGTRQSEDLDFMRWRTNNTEKMEVAWRQIERELSLIGEVQNVDILDIDHVEFIVEGVKLSFYACDKYSPLQTEVHYQDNLKLADLTAIGAMKMEVMLRRSNFRDYYDIYSLLVHGIELDAMVTVALDYSRHRLKSKTLYAMLTNGERFFIDKGFKLMQPIYDVTQKDIEKYIMQNLQKKSYPPASE